MTDKEKTKDNNTDEYKEHELVVSATEFGRDEETGERLVNLHVGTLILDVDTYQKCVSSWVSSNEETLTIKVYTKK